MTDTRIWLEDVDSAEALDWVKARNSEKAEEVASTESFAQVKDRILATLDSEEKIPAVSKVGDYYYNFWTDADHERGLWRRTSLESYRTDNPDWEIVLDVDALNEAEGENWVWHGATVLPGENDEYRLAIVDLSRGGADADVSREFDLHSKTFVEGGFFRPESKGGVSWIDEDTVFVSTDTGEGSMTTSGYPRFARRWSRGQEIADAPVVFEALETDMSAFAYHDSTPGFERDFVRRALAFYNSETYLLQGEVAHKIDVQNSAKVGVHRQWMLIQLREDWTAGEQTYPADTLLVTRFDDFMAGGRDFQVLYSPSSSTSLAGAIWTKDNLVLTILDDVKNRVEVHSPAADGTFSQSDFAGLPSVGTVAIGPVDSRHDNAMWVTTTDFLTPTTLSIAQEGGALEPLKSMPTFFDADGLIAEQHFATSKDGTKVPYFLVRREDVPLDGTTPTLLSAYGGFEISRLPTYSGALGSGWLERGGAYVLANIRGGGEYGSRWHQAALKANRHRAYEDLAAVATDLVDRGVTNPKQLGVQGGSNGGLLTGNMLVQYPELFGAIVIQVPLLDMRRYNQLLAGASWMAEYGDPDKPEEWEFIKTFSPYHLFDAGAKYPPVLFTTSTRDDRVHPGHARKMAHMMLQADADVTYYENIEGGHGGAATNGQAAHMWALAYRFLAERLGLK